MGGYRRSNKKLFLNTASRTDRTPKEQGGLMNKMRKHGSESVGSRNRKNETAMAERRGGGGGTPLIWSTQKTGGLDT